MELAAWGETTNEQGVADTNALWYIKYYFVLKISTQSNTLCQRTLISFGFSICCPSKFILTENAKTYRNQPTGTAYLKFGQGGKLDKNGAWKPMYDIYTLPDYEEGYIYEVRYTFFHPKKTRPCPAGKY